MIEMENPRQSVIRKYRTSFMQFLSTFESEQDTDIDSNTADDIDLRIVDPKLVEI